MSLEMEGREAEKNSGIISDLVKLGTTDAANDSNSESDSDSDSDSDSSSSDGDEEELIAQKLTDQLLEDIRRAREMPVPTLPQNTPKEDAALATMKTILAFAAEDPLVRSTLSSATIPGVADENMLSILNKFIDENRINKSMAGSLTQVVLALAKSEVLFPPLPSTKSAKRKRADNGSAQKNKAKRPAKSGAKGRQ